MRVWYRAKNAAATPEALEYFQIKAILKFRLKAFQNIFVSVPKNPHQIPIFHASVADRSITARRFHQREQLIDRLLRDVADAIAVLHAGDVDTLHDRADLVAEICEEPEGIALLVGDARDQSGDQDLARDHFSVQLVHAALPVAGGRMNERHRPR